MIIYKSTVKKFREDILNNKIDEEIDKACLQNIGRSVLKNEGPSWRNSLNYMERVVRLGDIPDDCGILIEYIIPSTSNRIDFLISGKDRGDNNNFIIVELKQWEKAQRTNKNSIVKTLLKGNPDVETPHPSYQAYSYKMLLKDFNENVHKGNLLPSSCAYLHNYIKSSPEPLESSIYADIVNDTPIFFKHDAKKLADFIKRHIGNGSGESILYEIENGKIRPTRKLIDYVCKMFKGNQEFILIDQQKVAYEKAIDIALNAVKKSVLIIKGGPGTGKSVISMNILGGILSAEKNVAFVAPNSNFRNAMVETLAKENSSSRIKPLFKGSSSFVDVEHDIYDVLVVDEAHRLKNEKAYQYRGFNQIEDIIKASLVSIFFIDDNQRIRPEDIGTVSELKRIASKYSNNIEEIELTAQFRCSGAEGFINWLDDVLHIKPTANYDGWNQQEFEFEICTSPQDLHSRIKQKNLSGYKARLLAGYAWPWTSAKNGNQNAQIKDVFIPEHQFSMPWNSRSLRTNWAIDKNGINQIGCIHTSQGLEFDYVGVIVGKDLNFHWDKYIYSVDWKNYKDQAGKKGLKDKPEELSFLVKNIYKILMSRGIKGCYVYFCNKDVEQYFKQRLSKIPKIKSRKKINKISEEELFIQRIEKEISDKLKYNEYLPVYSLEAAAGKFGEGMDVENEGWLKIDIGRKLNRRMFVAKVVGKSMEPRIPNNSYCVFRRGIEGSRQGKIVLVQHNDISDPDTGGKYTVKKYTSKKRATNDSWEHEEINLLPLNSDYDPINIPNSEEGGFMVIAEFISVLL
jgi:uncharacterized protein